jgi:hypothetical protein
MVVYREFRLVVVFALLKVKISESIYGGQQL